MSELTPELIAELLGPTKSPQQKANTPQKKAPKRFLRKPTQYLPHNTRHLHHRDKEGRCASRGCNSSTYHQWDGAYYCNLHLLLMCAGKIDELEDKLEVSQKGYGML